MNEHSKQNNNKTFQILDLPQDIFMGLPDISLSGNRKLYISNHRGILSYDHEEMTILVKEFQIHVKGKGLAIDSYTKDDLTISGYIHSMEFV